MLIRIADESLDINHVAEMLVELDKIHHDAAPDRFPLLPIAKRKNDIIEIIKTGYIFFAEKNSQIVGFASVIKKGDSLLIEHLFVEPKFRHQNIATKIVMKIFDSFPEKEIFTTAFAFNKDAINFYKSFFELSSMVFRKPRK